MSAPVAIVTDSTSDMDAAMVAAFGVEVVPLFINFGERRYRDTVDLSRADFYAKLASDTDLPTTSQPTSAMFEDVFRPHVAAGRPIVCITLMVRLSGTVNAATAAAAQFPDASIAIVDSESVSGGLAMQAMHAADLARSGSDVPAILAALARDREVQRGYATLPDLSHAVRTGRISRTQAFIGSLVKILPVLRVDRGRVDEEARVRTFARAQDTMIERAVADINAAPEARVVVMHAHATAVATAMAERLRAAVTVPLRSFDFLEAGPAIAAHAGSGAVGIFVLPA